MVILQANEICNQVQIFNDVCISLHANALRRSLFDIVVNVLDCNSYGIMFSF